MIESNIISWIELGDSMQYIDVYGKRKMVKLFNFLRILMVYNSFTTFFFIILHFIFFIQLAMLCLLGVPSGNDWIVKIFKFFWNVFLLENIIQGETSYKIAIIIITAVTFVIIGCSIFLMIGQHDQSDRPDRIEHGLSPSFWPLKRKDPSRLRGGFPAWIYLTGTQKSCQVFYIYP